MEYEIQVSQRNQTLGWLHSVQTMGAVDGPGIRFVIFLQGCPLRCIYCHNPDTWELGGINGSKGKSDARKEIGTAYRATELVQKVLRYRSYFGEEGGVTLSGGEPLLQWEFAAELFRQLRQEGIHTALDTSGIGDLDGARQVLQYTNLVLCDLKFHNGRDYMAYCKADYGRVKEFLELTEDMAVPLWVRHVVVPGLTDSEASIRTIVEKAKAYSNFKKLELLPFRKLSSVKYQEMGITFPLADTPECTEEKIDKLTQLLG